LPYKHNKVFWSYQLEPGTGVVLHVDRAWSSRYNPARFSQSGLYVGNPEMSSAAQRKLLVVIPALNESETVDWLIRRIPRQIPGIDCVEVVLVDDGSTDATGRIAAEVGADVIRNDRRQGVGMVFHQALELVVQRGADIMVFMDGDGQFAPHDIPRLVKPIVDGNADRVSAPRYHPESPPHRQALPKRLGNMFMAKLVSVLVGRKIYDSACGFRAYSAKAAMSFNLSGKFTYTQEVLLDLCFKDLRLAQIPIRVRGRKHGESRVASSLVRYAFQASVILLRAYRDYRPMRFFGLITAVQLVFACAIGAFFVHHRLVTGKFTPHLWAGFLAGFLFVMGGLTFLTGLLADMLDRVRMAQEKILFYEKLQSYEQNKASERGERPATGSRITGSGDAKSGLQVHSALTGRVLTKRT